MLTTVWFLFLVTPDTLTDMANQMTEKVGLVHGLPYVADRQGFAATLEQVSSLVLSSLPSPFKTAFCLPCFVFVNSSKM